VKNLGDGDSLDEERLLELHDEVCKVNSPRLNLGAGDHIVHPRFIQYKLLQYRSHFPILGTARKIKYAQC